MKEVIYKRRGYGRPFKVTPEILLYFDIPYGILAFPLSGFNDDEEDAPKSNGVDRRKK